MGDGGSARRGFLTRRQALRAGATAVGSLAVLDGDAEARGEAVSAAGAGHLGGRHEVSFDEGWLFHLGDVGGAQASSFDDRGWRRLDVPHDWQIEDRPSATSTDAAATDSPSGFAFVTSPSPDGTPPAAIGPFDKNASAGGRSQGYTVGGVGWYRKHFRVPGLQRDERERRLDGDEQRVELRFDGIYQNADVWLNGVHLGFHPNGYTSFAYDLTPHLNRRGHNVLAVRVDTTGKNSRWYSGSGIYRHTWLTVTGPVRIPLWGVYVTTPHVSRGKSIVRTEVQVTNSSKRTPVRVRVEILDARGRRVARHLTAPRKVPSGRTVAFTAQLAVHDAALWSPDSPNLYRARTEVLVGGRVLDRLETTFGIRSLVWNGQVGFLLNGKPIKIDGGCIHHDHGPLGAIALDRAEERTIELLKAAGFNSMRASHNPRSPYMLDVCDRLGMLVWDEFSDMWDVQKNPQDYHLYFPKHWKQDLRSMVLRDRNHPSVIIWSLGNEIPSDPNNYGPRLYKLVKTLDRTRPVSVGGTSAPYADVDDIHYGNIASQITGLASTDTVVSDHGTYPTHAITQSESFPATIYDDYKLAQDNRWFVGNWVWAAWDYLGEAGCGATPIGPTYNVASAYALAAVSGSIPYPWFQDFQGDLDLIGQRKPQNFWRAVVAGRSPLEMLVERPPPPGINQYAALWGYYDELESWTWDVLPDQPLKVHVYTSGDSVQLLLNGTTVGTNTLTEADGRVTTFSVLYSPGELTAVASRGGKEIARKTLTTTGSPAALRLSPDVRSLTTSRDDLAHVLVEVVDSQGRRVPDAVVDVAFDVGGAGELAGAASGNPHNVDSFKRPGHYTWHGQAMAILRPAKTPGTITLSATAAGLAPARLTLPVRRAATPHIQRRPRSAAWLTAGIAGVGGPPALVVGLVSAVIGRRLRRTAEGRPS